jgi:hypothetical protein
VRPRPAVPAVLAAALVGALALQPAAAAAGGSFQGKVTGPDGGPLEGVCVAVQPADGDGAVLEATTGADGTYTVEDVPTGDQVVGFNSCAEPLAGFAPEWYDDQPRADVATPVAVPASGLRTGLDAALARTGSISGTVSDQDTMEPLADICAIAFGDETLTFAEARTGAEGTYVLRELPAGDYVVLFGDCGSPYTHLTEIYDDVQFDATTAVEPTPVTVVTAEETAGIDAALEEGGAVEGTVTGLHTGRPQSLVCIGLFPAAATDEDEFPAGDATSGIDPFGSLEGQPGAYTVAGVRPGDYVLSFNADFCADDGYDTSWFDGKGSRDDATILTVRKGEVRSAVDGVVAPRPSISVACPPFFEEPPTFSDVPPENVHQRAVDCMAGYGVVTGKGDGSFRPADQVSRAQIASFLARALRAAGVELPADPADAYDDDEASVHELAINQLAELGVLSGKGARRFAPDDTVDRGQLATLLVAGYERVTGFDLIADGDRFADDDGTTHEASANKASTAGLAAGVSTDRYAPAGLVRRDQAASALARLIDRTQRDLATGGLSSFSAGSGDGSAPVRADLRRLARDAAARLRD